MIEEGVVELWWSLMVAVTWQLAALAIIAWVFEKALRLRLRQPRVRHSLWWFVLVAPLVLAPGRMALAKRQVAVHVPAPAAIERVVSAARLPSAEPVAPAALRLRPSEADFGGGPPYRDPRLPVALAWALGCALMLARLAVGHLRVRRMLRAARPLEDEQVLAALAELERVAGVSREVRLLESTEAGAAMLYGWRWSAIVVPADWLESLQPRSVEALLLHELAHIRRGDFLAATVQRIVEALMFFHPLVWVASRRIGLVREELCDAWAAGRVGETAEYARTLLAAAERTRGSFALASVGIAESKSALRRRVEVLIRARGGRRLKTSVVLAIALVLATAAGALGLGQLAATDRGSLQPWLAEMISQLASRDAGERQEALTTIMDDPQHAAPAVPTLMGMLLDDTVLPAVTYFWAEVPATTVSEQAGEALEYLGEVALPAVARALDDADPRRRRAAALALSRLVMMVGTQPVREAAGEKLALLLQDPDRLVAQAAAVALGKSGDERALPMLLEMMAAPDPVIRARAADGLTYLRAPAARDALFAAFADGDEKVRERASFAFGYTSEGDEGERLAGALASPDPRVRAAAARAFHDVNDEGVMEAGYGALLAALNDPIAGVRRAALEGLWSADRMGGRLRAKPLLPLANDRDAAVRAKAMEMLGLTGEPAAVGPLVAALGSDPDAGVRAEAAGWLRSNDPKVVAALVAALGDADDGVRIRAAMSLGEVADPSAVGPLAGLLRDGNQYVRLAAISALGRTGGQAATKALIPLLRDREGKVGAAAASALGNAEGAEAAEALLGAARDRWWQVRRAAARGLGGRPGAPLAQALVSLLDDPYWQVRSAAAEALGRSKARSAVPALIDVVRKDDDPAVRAEAVRALGQIGDRRALTVVAALVGDANERVRWAAVGAVSDINGGRAGGELERLLAKGNADQREAAARALGGGGEAAITPLIGALKDQAPQVRGAAAESLGLMDDARIVAPLLGLLDDPDEYVRGRADWALSDGIARKPSKRTAAPFIEALRSRDVKVRRAAASALSRLKDPSAVGPLIEALEQDGDEEVRYNAVVALGAIGDRRAAKPLIAALKDPGFRGRSEAAWALGGMRELSAAPALIACLRDEHVAYAAADALGQMKVKGAVGPLITLLRQGSRPSSHNAAAALGVIGDRRAVPALMETLDGGGDEHLRAAAAKSLGQLGDRRALEALVRASDEESRRVKPAALAARGYLGDRSAADGLLEVLQTRNMDKADAAGALGVLGDQRAVRPLIPMLRRSGTMEAINAATSLGKLRAEEAVPELIWLLGPEGTQQYGPEPGVAGRVQRAAGEALRAITGKRFGTDYGAWTKWWRERNR
ncbi:MAG: HEAT repeat domain-containing protein [Armatimonadota bacterium]